MTRRLPPILLVLLLGLPAGARAEGDAVLVESGESSFRTHCSACHGFDARGQGPVAAALQTPPADLTRIAARRGGAFPDAEIARFIDGRSVVAAHGSREMPVWGRIFAQPIAHGTTGEEVVRGQLFVLVEYLKSIQAPVAGAP